MPFEPTMPLAEVNRRQRNRDNARAYYYKKKGTKPPLAEPFDARLNKRVDFTLAAKLSKAERQQLEAELGCLRREQAQVQRGIDHLTAKLAA